MYIYKLSYIEIVFIFLGVCISLVSSRSHGKSNVHSSACVVPGRNYSVVIESKQLEAKAFVYGFLSSDGETFNITNPFNKTEFTGPHNDTITDQYCNKLKQLVNMTKTAIPGMKPEKTPLAFVATGVANKTNATEFLYNATKCLNTTGFEMWNDSAIQLHGKRKLYSWMSVNLLLGRFDNKIKNARQETAAVLDLGSAGAHDEFELTTNKTLPRRQKRQMTNVTVCGQNYTLFGYSGHGLGLYDARVGILTQGYVETEDLTHNNMLKAVTVKTPCLQPGVSTTWSYKDTFYVIEGTPTNSSHVNMTACRLHADYVIKNHSSHPEDPVLLGREIYGITYYYQVLNESKIVTHGENKNITVQDIEAKAKEICQKPYKRGRVFTPGSLDDPFACMDLIYTHQLLMTFYHLKNHTSLDVVLKLNGVNADWTLGLAFDRYKKQSQQGRKLTRRTYHYV